MQRSGGEAAYLILGAKLTAPHHHPEFDFDESVLASGVALLESWLLGRLAK
ncbi:p-aminobenzoyl-glutamate hydrolase subunit A [compost metagenome]